MKVDELCHDRPIAMSDPEHTYTMKILQALASRCGGKCRSYVHTYVYSGLDYGA